MPDCGAPARKRQLQPRCRRQTVADCFNGARKHGVAGADSVDRRLTYGARFEELAA